MKDKGENTSHLLPLANVSPVFTSQVAEVWGRCGGWRGEVEQALCCYSLPAQPVWAAQLPHQWHRVAWHARWQHRRDCRWELFRLTLINISVPDCWLFREIKESCVWQFFGYYKKSFFCCWVKWLVSLIQMGSWFKVVLLSLSSMLSKVNSCPWVNITVIDTNQALLSRDARWIIPTNPFILLREETHTHISGPQGASSSCWMKKHN